MGAECAPPYACLVVDYKDKTKSFLIKLPKFFSTEEIKIIKELFRRYIDKGCLLWPAMLNFDSFIIYFNNLHPSINYTYQTAKVKLKEMKKKIQFKC